MTVICAMCESVEDIGWPCNLQGIPYCNDDKPTLDYSTCFVKGTLANFGRALTEPNHLGERRHMTSSDDIAAS
ncbi:unnamed protein product [Bursaphelenchus xylophilus]|uniref:(pine wood nematode) hypothetical protein n=1 Tax=Bursaphelenchus xylophilus TaxID=6326 RepID=A0A1I7SG49_BURXY|nr:unnamed protein product [Bursaphelenchus xylophilus]CAG9131662.1 unnamed protein product [Bursaphelenchus xylophilus]